MRAIAAILSVYFLGLFIQPALSLLLPKPQQKVMSCCEKLARNKENKKHKDDNKDCCGSGKCNPFYSQCPACTSIAAKSMIAPVLHPVASYYEQIKFPSAEQHLISHYLADVLQPPEMIG